jgi:hypothetical protein
MTEATSSAPEAPSTFDSVADAVAELDRRDAARAEQRAADKAAKAAPAPAPADANPEAQDAPGQEAHEEPDTDTPLPEEEESAASEEVATDDPVEPEQDEPPAVINFDGKALEIPKGTPPALVEAVTKLGNDLKADYTRKTQEVATERSQVHAAYQQTSQLAQHLQQAQATLAQFYQAAIGEPPPLELAQTDPQAFLIQREMHTRRVQQYQQLMAQGQELSQSNHQMAEQGRAQYLNDQMEKLVKAAPELANKDKRAEFTSRIGPVADKYGVTAQELAAIGDHRVLLMLRDLARLQSREQAAGNVKTKMANVPPKVNKPGTASQDQGKGQKAAQAKQQFMRSGKSMRDVARYLAQTERD